MASDVSRVRQRPEDDYAGTTLQQGRVLLDADWNEQAAIVDRRLRAAAADLGSPGPVPPATGVAVVPRTTPHGFELGTDGHGLTVGPGRMYVDGLLADCHGTDPQEWDPLLTELRGKNPVPVDAQPYRPSPPPAPPAVGTRVVYLDVWRREVTALEAPELVEVALGVDTTTRVQTAWQVKVLADDAAGADCSTVTGLAGWQALVAPRPEAWLTTGTSPVVDTGGACSLPPVGGYRGLENQTYRVEICAPGPAGTATFCWSRDNASVASAVVQVVSATEVRPASLGRDEVLAFATGDWVEITDDRREFDGLPGELREVTVDVGAGTMAFAPVLPPAYAGLTAAQAAATHLRVRRWDQKHTIQGWTGTSDVVLQDLDAVGSTGAVTVPVGTAVVLENGITAAFGAGPFRTGDHWIVAARTNDVSVEPLQEAPPLGIHHHYAPLGLVEFGIGAPVVKSDCRVLWPPAAEAGGEGGCCSVDVTPESHASGAMTLQAAVDQVSSTGGTVCLAVGHYPLKEPVEVDHAVSVTIHGQGPTTVLLASSEAFEVATCLALTIEDLTVAAPPDRIGIRVAGSAEVTLQRLTLLQPATPDDLPNGPEDGPGAIRFDGVVLASRVRDCTVIAPTMLRAGSATSGDKLAHPALLGDVTVADNVAVCTGTAILLDGTIGHVFGTDIRGNTVWQATAGVVATGAVGSRADLRVSGNRLLTTTSGVRVAGSGVTVADNTVAIAGATDGAQPGDGVSVVDGSAAALRGRVRVAGNRVRGARGAGVGVTGTFGDLVVADTTIDACANGIQVTAVGDATVVVSGNSLQDIAAPDGADDDVVGIQVLGGERIVARDNTLRRIGMFNLRSTTAGIRVIGAETIDVTGNRLGRVGTIDVSETPVTGLHVIGPFARVVVERNDVTRLDGDARVEGATAFCSLRVELHPARDGVTRIGNGLTVLRRPSGTLLFTEVERDLVPTRLIPVFAAAAADPGTAVRVLGNSLSGGGIREGVWIDAGDAGLVVVSDNQICQAATTDRPALHVAAVGATVSANQILAGQFTVVADIVIGRQSGYGSLATVLGNLSSGRIHLNGNDLDAPWSDLNSMAL